MLSAEIVQRLVGIAIALVLVAGMYLFGHHQGTVAADARWEVAINKQKQDAKNLLDLETAKTRTVESKLAEAKDTLEKRDADAQVEIDRVRADNRRLVAAAGGVLHDPGRRSSGGCTAPQVAGAASAPQGETSGGELSAEATQFLLDFAYDADEAAKYAKSCKAWVDKLTELMGEPSVP